jgi:G3E family GTPase
MRINAGLRVPLTVIGGFLGAGKTTLVNALLAEPHGLRLAVLVNDFGAVNIDASLIAARDGDMVALSNGCVCCAMGDDLGRGIMEMLARRPPPDHIVVEASGVADPWRIAEIALLDPDLCLSGVVVLADASRIEELSGDRLVGETARRQLLAADLLILTKPDLVAAKQLAALPATLTPVAPRARFLIGMQGAVPASLVLGEMAAEPRPTTSARARSRPHGAIFESATLRPLRPVMESELRKALEMLPDTVLRVKGLLSVPDSTADAWLVQGVGRRVEISRHCMPSGTEHALVLIATGDALAAAQVLRGIGLVMDLPPPASSNLHPGS